MKSSSSGRTLPEMASETRLTEKELLERVGSARKGYRQLKS